MTTGNGLGIRPIFSSVLIHWLFTIEVIITGNNHMVRKIMHKITFEF